MLDGDEIIATEEDGEVPDVSVSSDPLKMYRKAARATPLLTADEEAQLARAIEEGQMECIRALVGDDGSRRLLFDTSRALAEGRLSPVDLPAYRYDSHDAREGSDVLESFAGTMLQAEAEWLHGVKEGRAADEGLDRLAGAVFGICRGGSVGFGVVRRALHELLRRDAACAAARAAVAGDAKAAAALDRFIRSNMRLVIHMAMMHANRGVPTEDLVQEGMIGAMRAALRFDWRMGLRFSTYATWWIRQAVVRFLAEHSRTVRLPSHVVERIVKIRKAEAALTARLSRPATVVEVAWATGLPEHVLESTAILTNRTLPIDQPLSGDPDDGRSLAERLEDPAARDDGARVARRELVEDLSRLLIALKPRQEMVIRMRYGIGSRQKKPMTLDEVGEELGISRERVRQIEAKGLMRLRRLASSVRLSQHID